MFAKRKSNLTHNSKLERRLEKMPLTDIIDWCDNNGTLIATALDKVRRGDNKEVYISEAAKSVNELHQAITHLSRRLGILDV